MQTKRYISLFTYACLKALLPPPGRNFNEIRAALESLCFIELYALT